MTKDSTLKLNHNFRYFQVLAIIFGGLGPIFFYFFIGFLCGIENFWISKHGFGIIAILFIITCCLTGFLIFKEALCGEEKWFGYAYSIQAVFCFLLVTATVYFTGGAKASIFSFTFLYIPSVVGYVYGKHGLNMKGAVFSMFVSYAYNLFWPLKERKDFAPNEIFVLETSVTKFNLPQVQIEYIYIGIFLLQLCIVFSIAERRSDLRNNQ